MIRRPDCVRPRAIGRPGFTLIELLVVISIIALLIGILLPVLGSARETARGSASLSNVRQINLAAQAYSADSKEFLLPFTNTFYFEPYRGADFGSGFIPSSAPEFVDRYVWPTRLIADGYLPDAQVYLCPTFETTRDLVEIARAPGSHPNWKQDPDWYKVHYGMNFAYLGSRLDAPTGASGNPTKANSTPRMSDVFSPSETNYFADSKNLAMERGSPAFGPTTGYVNGETAGVAYLFPGEDPPDESYGHADARHNSAINVAYADGHGSSLRVDDPTRIWGPDELTDSIVNPDDNHWDRR